ncbi:LOW QUALITY PROTEIN: hypothetical protein Cgig2_013736 [Carnegiea gigantea]|uniref:Peptidase A2 domain-containing protein n=1 Tax=Carnegiea gigantea TaxID=171969 RepID=A0A9Q1Q8C3_9CARY|nr:LOW QUALITY PROTEIN: hypothetical protein Cgig2_013736 [Carnegiea gigantea]
MPSRILCLMTDAILQQVSEQVKKWRLHALRGLSSISKMCVPRAANPPIDVNPRRPPVVVRGCKRPLMLVDIGGHGRNIAVTLLGPTHTLTIAQAAGVQQSQPLPPRLMQCTLDEQHGLKNRNRPRAPGERAPNGVGLLSATLHELANKGQIHRFLKQGPRFLRKEREPAWPKSRDEECSIEIVATITDGYAKDITRFAWKAQLRGAQQVLTVEQGSRVTVPTMVFGREQGPHFTSPHNNPLVVGMKVASAIVERILIDTGSSVDIITWDYLKKLTYPGRDIVPLVHPILGFGG